MEIKKIIENLIEIEDQLQGEEWKESIKEAIDILRDYDKGNIFKRFIEEHNLSKNKVSSIEETIRFEPLKNIEVVEDLIEQSESWEERNSKD